MTVRYAATLAMVAATATAAAGVPVLYAQSTPIVMKLATPTLNDGQHEWIKR